MCEWIDNNIHPEWYFSQALSRGVGVHHRRIPHSSGKNIVHSFNAGNLQFSGMHVVTY